MPYYRKRFKRTGRRFFKRRYITKSTIQRRFYRKAMTVKRAKPEIKYIFNAGNYTPEFNSTTLSPNSGVTLIPTSIEQGPNINQRIGNKIKSLRVTVEFEAALANVTGGALNLLTIPLRIVIVQPRIDTTRATDFLNTLGQKPISPMLFRIYKDYTHTVVNPYFRPAVVDPPPEPGQYGSSANPKCIVKYKKCFRFPRNVAFTYNTINDVPQDTTDTDPTNLLWMWVYPGVTNLPSDSIVSYNIRWKYKYSFIDI